MNLQTGRAMLLGPTMDSRVAFDVIQRLPHLAIRIREHVKNGIVSRLVAYRFGVHRQSRCSPGTNEKGCRKGIVSRGIETLHRSDVLHQPPSLIPVSIAFVDGFAVRVSRFWSISWYFRSKRS